MQLESERLIVREFKEEDIDELALILGDPEVMKYSLKGPLSKEETLDYLRQRMLKSYEEHGYGLWALVSKETNRVIGLAGPINQIIDGEEYVEIGYRITRSEWGKGFATEAVECIRDFAFTHLHLDKVIAIIDPSNTQSIRVAEKAGYKLQKTTTFHGFHVGIYELHRITVVPYTEKWVERFDEERSRLEKVFQGIPIQFEHIGSTSIPGCHAKPKIDILGITNDITAIDQFNEKMIQMGYSPLGELGIKQRRYFILRGDNHVNLHVFEDTNPEVARHLRFRDYLRTHPEKKKEYSSLKMRLAEQYPGSILEYCLGKESFVKAVDYQAAMEDTGKYFNLQSNLHKSSWSDKEILQSMEANMHLQMTYFAKYVPNIDIIFQLDVTVVYSSIPDDTFNYVIGAKFSDYNVKDRVEHVLNLYREKGIPFSWWLGEKDTPETLEDELTSQGLSLKEDDIGMYLSLDEYESKESSSEISMTRVLGEKGLRDFAKVFADLGGYPNLYEDLYSKLPPVLIADGGPYEMYVGYLDGQPIVTGVLVLHANVAGIYYVMTVPEQRRRGFGSLMMQYLINRSKEEGYPLVTLQASAAGKGLYERLGFKSMCRFVEYS